MIGLMRCLVVLVAAAGLATQATAYEVNKDRPGGDYANITLPAGSIPLACDILCQADGTCKAWTFVKAGVQAPNPRCWLKSTVPPIVNNSCCVSGVKGPAAEVGFDRPGNDYTNVTLPAGSNFGDCRALCLADAPCVAWTFVEAGVQAPNPRCWLKSSIPAKVPNACCTSGVK